MADPVIQISPAPIADGLNTTVDTSGFSGKLAATDNLLQEVADALDVHTHAYSEITDNTHTHGLSMLSDFIAPDDAGTDLGAADKRWKDIYASTAIIQTSDRNLKCDIVPIKDCWGFLSALDPVEFKFVGGQRVHTGFIAQDVRDKIYYNYAIYCEAKGISGLRYEEAIAPIAGCVRDLDNRVALQYEWQEVFGDRFYQEIARLDAKVADLSIPAIVVPPPVEVPVPVLAPVPEPRSDMLSWVAIGISVIAMLVHFL